MPAALTAIATPVETTSDNFQRYYEEAGPDYAAWSLHFNMHFGFFRRGIDPLNRKAMLEQMNREVFDRLRVTAEHPRILDMGCGLGATLRSIARQLPSVDLHGVTLVPWQLEQGRRLNQSTPQSAAITLNLGDYERTAFTSETFDSIYAIDSVVLKNPSTANSATAGSSKTSAKSTHSPANSNGQNSAKSPSSKSSPASPLRSSTSPGSHSNSSSHPSSSAKEE